MSSNYEEFVNIRELKVGVNLSLKASDIVHELQKERGLTAGFLASNGEKFKRELNSQRDNSDKKIEIY